VNTANNRFTELNYDAAGNVSGEKLNLGNRMEYKYDAENHVVAAGINIVTSGTAPTSRYFYDAAGKRTRKVVSGVETWFVYGIDGELVAEYNANGAVGSPQKEYGYRSGQLLVVYDNTEPLADKKLQWMVADHLGTPRMVIDKTGSLSGIKRHDYLPFGEEIGAGVGIRSAGNGYTADQIRKKFTSYERDLETGLDYARARYYSNVSGRFTSVDSFAGNNWNPQSLNRYSYVQNNPTKWNDPTGHSAQDPKGKCTQATPGEECTKMPDTEGKKPTFLGNLWKAIKNVLSSPTPPKPGVETQIAIVVEDFKVEMENPSRTVLAPTVKLAPKITNETAKASFTKDADGDPIYVGYYLESGIDLYKVFSNPDYMTAFNKDGLWLTGKRWESSIDAIEQMALAWGQSAEYIVKVHVPAGTAIYEGRAGPQNTDRRYEGGAGQYYIRPEDFARVKFSSSYEKVVPQRPPGK
jgi:RHS repeat-associated protein